TGQYQSAVKPGAGMMPTGQMAGSAGRTSAPSATTMANAAPQATTAPGGGGAQPPGGVGALTSPQPPPTAPGPGTSPAPAAGRKTQAGLLETIAKPWQGAAGSIG